MQSITEIRAKSPGSFCAFMTRKEKPKDVFFYVIKGSDI